MLIFKIKSEIKNPTPFMLNLNLMILIKVIFLNKKYKNINT